ncbi:MAG: MBL fold metallo-hydrolase [Methanoregula sp.]|nr:MBL fold metallo-hydrolase [Methanoregula sp.]
MQRSGPVFFFLCLSLLFAGCIQPDGSGISDQHPAVFTGGSNLTVYFISVGQGDSILVRSPAGKTLLIDAGPASSSSGLVSFLHEENVSSLDILLATHSHEDHIGGMPAVLAAFPVGEVIYNGFPGNTTYYERFMKTVAKKKIPLTNVTAGDTISLDPVLSISVLNSRKTYFDDPNNNSVVLRLVYRNVSFLFAGDAAQGAESAMLANGDNLSATVLKVGHHGDSRSTGTQFLRAVHPEIAVIEAGYKNDHHNPSNKTLNRFRAANVTIYRTDLNGTVMIDTDGTNLWVSTMQDSPALVLPVPENAAAATAS